MKLNSETYYLIFESWKLDSNQWSILMGSVGISLTFIGFVIAFILYYKQRIDNSKEAFDYFQSSLPELKVAMENTIENLEQFKQNLDSDKFLNPILSASLNDKFLNKINLIDLNRFYKNKGINSQINLQKFLNDSNFFGYYHAYFTNEMNYFRSNYLEKEKVFSQWQLLRSNKFFSTLIDDKENINYKQFYKEWVANLNSDKSVFKYNSKGEEVGVKSREKLINMKIKPLAKDIFRYIQYSEKANEVNLIANKVVMAYSDLSIMKTNFKKALENDVVRFKEIISNMERLMI